MKKFLVMLLSMLLLAATVVCASADTQPDFQQEMQKLKDLPKDEFMRVLLTSGNNMSQSDSAPLNSAEEPVSFMYAATVFLLRIDEYTNDEILEMALNTQNSIYVRELGVQMFGQKNKYASSDSRLVALLDDPATPQSLKSNIIVCCGFSSAEDMQKLKTISNASDGALAFQALKKLSKISLPDAIEIADKIIANYKQEDEQKVCAAIKAKSLQFESTDQTFGASTDKRSFIDFCATFYSQAQDQTSKDTAIFALSDLGEEAAVSKILSDESVDRVLKVHTVSRNESVLKDMVTNDPTAEDLVIASKAMSLYPSDEIAQALTVAKQTVPNAESIIAQSSSELDSNATARASGNQGYACYRNGVDILGFREWHAAIINSPYPSTSDNYAVVHANLGYNVMFGNWNDFLYGVGKTSGTNSNMGTYMPKSNISSAQRDQVMATARVLTSEQISYTFAGQMGYSPMWNGRKLEPRDIGTMRCDGVVEYSYEYNYIPIGGGTYEWNICIDLQDNYNFHNNAMMPTSQANTWMTRIG